MDSIIYALICLLSGSQLFLSAAGDGGSVDITFNPPGQLRQGDTLTITCTVTGKGRFDFVRIYREIAGTKYEISTNNNLQSAFQDSGRYKNTGYEEKDGVTTVKVEISNIQGRDAGRISCNLLPEDISAAEDISVIVKPKAVTIRYLDTSAELQTVNNDEIVLITEKVKSSLYCIVEVDGTMEAPKIEVLLDNKNVKGRFKQTVKKEDGQENGFIKKTQNYTLVYSTTDPNVDENGKTLVCKAKLPNFDALERKAKLEIKYGPQLECSKVVFTKLPNKNVDIVCKGKMHPPPMFSQWIFGVNNTVVRDDDESGAYTAVRKELEGDNYEFKLTLKDVKEEHLIKYRLEVQNEIGMSERRVKLHEEEYVYSPTTRYPSSTARISAVVDDKNNHGKGYELSAAPSMNRSWNPLLTISIVVAMVISVIRL